MMRTSSQFIFLYWSIVHYFHSSRSVCWGWVSNVPSTSKCTLDNNQYQTMIRNIATTRQHPRNKQQRRQQKRNILSRLNMGWFDDLFLTKRDGDFVKLEDTTDKYGPGPVLVVMNIPDAIQTDEIYDMISDTCSPQTTASCKVYRVQNYNNNDHSNYPPELDLSVQDLMQQIVDGKFFDSASPSTAPKNALSSTCVLFFSGFTNQEMMNLYNVISNEIYLELQPEGGPQQLPPPACAKAVRNSMQKPMKQVIDEICGDHNDAVKLSTTE